MNDLLVKNVSYREATVADCSAAARVHVQSWRESFTGIVPQTFLDKMSVESRAKAFEGRFSDDSYKQWFGQNQAAIAP